MPDGPESGVFLERRSYRRRRLIDGLKLLPFLGAWLFLLPIFWPGAGEETSRSMSVALYYVFGVWFALILLTALLVRSIRRSGPRDATDAQGEAGAEPPADGSGRP